MSGQRFVIDSAKPATRIRNAGYADGSAGRPSRTAQVRCDHGDALASAYHQAYKRGEQSRKPS